MQLAQIRWDTYFSPGLDQGDLGGVFRKNMHLIQVQVRLDAPFRLD